MATTTYVDTATAAEAIGARTTSGGAAATDLTAEEARLINSILTEGYLSSNAFKVSASSGMTVTVGSGSAKTDLYCVAGDVSGQGNYLVRLAAATQNVTVPAADASLARIDEVYLVVADAAYDAGSVALPRIGYRAGTAGGSAPGPDAAWKASVKLATIAVGAAVSSIVAGNITDSRVAAALVAAAPALAEEGWHSVGAGGEPAFSSGASNSGSGYQPLQFKKVANAVRVRGVVSATSSVFTLPSGYRPPLPLLFSVVDQFGSIGYGQILANGDVSVNKFGGGGMTFAALLITFWID